MPCVKLSDILRDIVGYIRCMEVLVFSIRGTVCRVELSTRLLWYRSLQLATQVWNDGHVVTCSTGMLEPSLGPSGGMLWN